MKKLTNKIALAMLTGCMLMGGSITAFAGSWQTDARGWIYQNDDGTYASNTWVLHNGCYYWLNSAGVMQSNSWINWNGNWYWVDENGVMVTNISKNINGKWYRFREDGTMITGWDKRDGKWYYFDSSGALTVGWQYVNNQWYYLGGSDGSMTTGWLDWNGSKYYLYSDGHMATGVQTVDGKEQLFRTDGRWIQDADTNGGQLTESDITIDSLFNAAYEDMDWEDIESLASKYYSNFYQTSANIITEINKWRASNKVNNLTMSSSLTKSAFALAITNKSFGYYGADSNETSGVVEHKAAAELFKANVDSLTMQKGTSLSDAIQKLYNKEQLAIITKPSYKSCGVGFIRLDDGTYVVVVELN